MLETAGFPDELAEEWRRFPVAAPTLLGEAARTGVPIFVGSAESHNGRYTGLTVPTAALGHQSWVALPLLDDGGPVGALGISFAEERELLSAERVLALTMASLCGEALQRARLGEAERAARAVAEAAVRAHDEIAAAVAHDLRNPLTSILAYGQVLSRRAARGAPIPVADVAEAAGEIEASARRMDQMIEGILEASRAGRGWDGVRHPRDRPGRDG